MLVWRVFPFVGGAAAGRPGHPLHVTLQQGWGRWDNPDLYLAMYVAASPTGAVGETFAHLSTWSSAMLPFPNLDGAERVLGVYTVDEERSPLLDLDDPRALLDRGLRPTDVVIRNRPRTQQIAREVFREGRWSGISWWSMHRPQWRLHVVWDVDRARAEGVEPLTGHPALHDAARLLAKRVDDDLT